MRWRRVKKVYVPEAAALEAWLKDKGYKPSSILAYCRDVRLLLHAGLTANATAVELTKYLARRAARGEMAGAARVVQAFRVWLKSLGMPARKDVLVSDEARDPPTYTREYVVATLAEGWTDDERATLWLIASGFEMQEAYTAVVDLEARTATIADRVAPLSPEAVEALTVGRVLDTFEGQERLRLKAAKVLSLRTLRISAAPYLMSLGVSPSTAAAVIGISANHAHMMKLKRNAHGL